MERQVEYKGNIIKYELTRKKVKNINLRVKPDLSVSVSASTGVSLKYIDGFVLSKAQFILNAVESYKSKSKEKTPNYAYDEFSALINRFSDEIFAQFKRDYGIDRPRIKLRNMKSRWGSCNFSKGIITLNANLIYCTEEQIHYVIVHEFSHLIVPNHSQSFYDIVAGYSPDYKRIRKEMREIII